MRAEQPLRTLVVEVVQRALLQLHGSLRLEAVGIFARLLAWRGGGHNLGHPVTKVMRVQPVAAEFIQPPCGGGSADGGRISGMVHRRNVRRQAFGEGEGLKCCGRRVAGIVADAEEGAEPE